MESTTQRFCSSRPLRRRIFNRLFFLVYGTAVITLIYRHAKTLLISTSSFHNFFIKLSIFLSDVILSFMWLNSQAFRANPVITEPFPQKLSRVLSYEDFLALDVFICTADPGKEPPVKLAATALSVMAYDYPPEKLSIYVSDDGGSELTLFALMEAAEFAKEWLPFCKENSILERCPNAYFVENQDSHPRIQKIKISYEKMRSRISRVVEKGFITDEFKNGVQAFDKWNQGFTAQEHPSVVQVLAQTRDDRDFAGNVMPNLVYVSREKTKAVPHHFKAGALNVLLRVSSVMTNAPIILTLDCDMISNDPKTPLSMLCFFTDHSMKSTLGYVQFTPHFSGVNKTDIYGSDLRRVFHINPMGMNGLSGPDYFGTGTFFARRAFWGGPASFIEPELPEFCPEYIPSNLINTQKVLDMALSLSSCNYENQSNWGSKIGFRYGSLVEDYYTGFQLHCEGWKSIYFNPERPAFLSEMPITLHDCLTQLKRWSVGLLEIALSKHNTLIYGTQLAGSLMAHCYSYYAFAPALSFSITIYAFLPQAAMLNNVSIFPKVTDRWFFLYAFLFIGAYGQDLIEFILAKGTLPRWWNDQRMWLTRGLSSDLFGTLEYIGNHLGIAARGFNVTSKVSDHELQKRYDEGTFEFGVASPMFVPLSAAAILNLAAFVWGVYQVSSGQEFDKFIGQMLIASFGVLNSFPVYDAIFFRRDKGRIPTKITVISAFIAWIVFELFWFVSNT